MQLSEQQQTKYNTYRKAGLEPAQALSLVKKNNPATPNKGIDNVLFGKGSITSEVGQGFKDATVGVVEDFVDIKDKYGLGEAIVRAPLTALAGAGEGVGRVVGSAVETTDDILLGGELGETLSPKVEEFLQTNTGQALINGIEYVDEKTHGVSGDILDSLNLLGVAGLVKSGAANSVKQGFVNTTKSVIGKTDDVIRKGVDKAKSNKSLLDDFAGEFDNLDDAMRSPKSGITDETTGIKSQFAPEKVSVPDKEFLLEVDPALGKRYLEAFKASEQSHKADNIFTVAIKDTKTAIDDYAKKTSEVGSEIGQIKQKMETAPINVSKIDDIEINLENTLQKKGLELVDGEFKVIEGRTSTFNPTDIALLNRLVRDLENVKTQGTGLEINNAIEVLDGIPGLQNITKTTAIDRLAMDIRGQLDEIRKAGLTDVEKAAFTEYSNAIGFVNDFKKGNLENKIAALLNKSGSKYENRLTEISKEIERVTGTKIEDYAMLTKVLTKASREGSRNASTLKQYFDSASLSPAATADGLVGKGLEKLFDTDLLDEFEKAINTTIKTE